MSDAGATTWADATVEGDDPQRPAQRSRRGWAWIALLVLAAVGLGTPLWTDARQSAQHPISAQDLATARAELAALKVKDPGPRTGYAREEFGSAWLDVDGNGCDTRNDILARDLTDVTYKDGDDCVIMSGRLVDPYGGGVIDFERGKKSSSAVQIEHVVALSDAWQKGAKDLDSIERESFANDPANLLAVDGPLNQSKGDKDAANWLPPATGYQCLYAARQIRVKAAYRLWVTQDERDALSRALDRCVVAPTQDETVPTQDETVPTQEAT